jgi:TatD DNase family protein
VIDFHCHLDLYPNPQAVADELEQRRVGVLSVTTTPAAWAGTSRLANGHPMIRTALGFHPELAGSRIRDLDLFERLLPETRFVGEVGLDGSPQHRPSWEAQIAVFSHILEAAERAGDKILSVHSRRAASQVLDHLERHPGLEKVILHWFTGTQTQLRRAVERGCWFGIGPAMLASARGRSLLSGIPTDRMVLETDGPFARNNAGPMHPWDIAAAVSSLAELWGVSRQDVLSRVQTNEASLLAAKT